MGATATGAAAVGGGGGGGGGDNVSGDKQYLDCEGVLIELSGNDKENNPTGKIRVLKSYTRDLGKGGVGWMTM